MASAVAREKREERDRRRAQRIRRARLRVAAIIVALLALASGAVALGNSDVFDVRTVEVVGMSRLTADEVRVLAAVPEDATLLRFPADAIKERLLANPWVAEVAITRDYPHTLQVRVTERVPLALVDTGEQLWVVDGQGMVLGARSAEETGTLIVVRDVPGLDLAPGRTAVSEVLVNALRVLSGVSDAVRTITRAVTAPGIDETMLVTADNVEILVGQADELEKKSLIIEEILREQAGSVVFIDVRSTERPVSRGLSD